MRAFFDFIADLIIVVFVLDAEIHPLDGFAIVVEVYVFDLSEEIDFGLFFFHLFVEDFLKGSGPAAVVLEANDIVVEFFLPFEILF